MNYREFLEGLQAAKNSRYEQIMGTEITPYSGPIPDITASSYQPDENYGLTEDAIAQKQKEKQESNLAPNILSTPDVKGSWYTKADLDSTYEPALRKEGFSNSYELRNDLKNFDNLLQKLQQDENSVSAAERLEFNKLYTKLYGGNIEKLNKFRKIADAYDKLEGRTTPPVNPYADPITPSGINKDALFSQKALSNPFNYTVNLALRAKDAIWNMAPLGDESVKKQEENISRLTSSFVDTYNKVFTPEEVSILTQLVQGTKSLDDVPENLRAKFQTEEGQKAFAQIQNIAKEYQVYSKLVEVANKSSTLGQVTKQEDELNQTIALQSAMYQHGETSLLSASLKFLSAALPTVPTQIADQAGVITTLQIGRLGTTAANYLAKGGAPTTLGILIENLAKGLGFSALTSDSYLRAYNEMFSSLSPNPYTNSRDANVLCYMAANAALLDVAGDTLLFAAGGGFLKALSKSSKFLGGLQNVRGMNPLAKAIEKEYKTPNGLLTDKFRKNWAEAVTHMAKGDYKTATKILFPDIGPSLGNIITTPLKYIIEEGLGEFFAEAGNTLFTEVGKTLGEKGILADSMNDPGFFSAFRLGLEGLQDNSTLASAVSSGILGATMGGAFGQTSGYGAALNKVIDRNIARNGTALKDYVTRTAMDSFDGLQGTMDASDLLFSDEEFLKSSSYKDVEDYVNNAKKNYSNLFDKTLGKQIDDLLANNPNANPDALFKKFVEDLAKNPEIDGEKLDPELQDVFREILDTTAFGTGLHSNLFGKKATSKDYVDLLADKIAAFYASKYAVGNSQEAIDKRAEFSNKRAELAAYNNDAFYDKNDPDGFKKLQEFIDTQSVASMVFQNNHVNEVISLMKEKVKAEEQLEKNPADTKAQETIKGVNFRLNKLLMSSRQASNVLNALVKDDTTDIDTYRSHIKNLKELGNPVNLSTAKLRLESRIQDTLGSNAVARLINNQSTLGDEIEFLSRNDPNKVKDIKKVLREESLDIIQELTDSVKDVENDTSLTKEDRKEKVKEIAQQIEDWKASLDSIDAIDSLTDLKDTVANLVRIAESKHLLSPEEIEKALASYNPDKETQDKDKHNDITQGFSDRTTMGELSVPLQEYIAKNNVNIPANITIKDSKGTRFTVATDLLTPEQIKEYLQYNPRNKTLKALTKFLDDYKVQYQANNPLNRVTILGSGTGKSEEDVQAEKFTENSGNNPNKSLKEYLGYLNNLIQYHERNLSNIVRGRSAGAAAKKSFLQRHSEEVASRLFNFIHTQHTKAYDFSFRDTDKYGYRVEPGMVAKVREEQIDMLEILLTTLQVSNEKPGINLGVTSKSDPFAEVKAFMYDEYLGLKIDNFLNTAKDESYAPFYKEVGLEVAGRILETNRKWGEKRSLANHFPLSKKQGAALKQHIEEQQQYVPWEDFSTMEHLPNKNDLKGSADVHAIIQNIIQNAQNPILNAKGNQTRISPVMPEIQRSEQPFIKAAEPGDLVYVEGTQEEGKGKAPEAKGKNPEGTGKKPKSFNDGMEADRVVGFHKHEGKFVPADSKLGTVPSYLSNMFDMHGRTGKGTKITITSAFIDSIFSKLGNIGIDPNHYERVRDAITKKQWRTSEGLFQAFKAFFTAPESQTTFSSIQDLSSSPLLQNINTLATSTDAGTLRSIGRNALKIDNVPMWDALSKLFMAAALQAKFSNEVLGKSLVETGDRVLIEKFAEYDMLPWAAGKNEDNWSIDNNPNNSNMLGVLLMELRSNMNNPEDFLDHIINKFGITNTIQNILTGNRGNQGNQGNQGTDIVTGPVDSMFGYGANPAYQVSNMPAAKSWSCKLKSDIENAVFKDYRQTQIDNIGKSQNSDDKHFIKIKEMSKNEPLGLSFPQDKKITDKFTEALDNLDKAIEDTENIHSQQDFVKATEPGSDKLVYNNYRQANNAQKKITFDIIQYVGGTPANHMGIGPGGNFYANTPWLSVDPDLVFKQDGGENYIWSNKQGSIIKYPGYADYKRQMVFAGTYFGGDPENPRNEPWKNPRNVVNERLFNGAFITHGGISVQDPILAIASDENAPIATPYFVLGSTRNSFSLHDLATVTDSAVKIESTMLTYFRDETDYNNWKNGFKYESVNGESVYTLPAIPQVKDSSTAAKNLANDLQTLLGNVFSNTEGLTNPIFKTDDSGNFLEWNKEIFGDNYDSEGNLVVTKDATNSETIARVYNFFNPTERSDWGAKSMITRLFEQSLTWYSLVQKGYIPTTTVTKEIKNSKYSGSFTHKDLKVSLLVWKKANESKEEQYILEEYKKYTKDLIDKTILDKQKAIYEAVKDYNSGNGAEVAPYYQNTSLMSIQSLISIISDSGNTGTGNSGSGNPGNGSGSGSGTGSGTGSGNGSGNSGSGSGSGNSGNNNGIPPVVSNPAAILAGGLSEQEERNVTTFTPEQVKKEAYDFAELVTENATLSEIYKKATEHVVDEKGNITSEYKYPIIGNFIRNFFGSGVTAEELNNAPKARQELFINSLSTLLKSASLLTQMQKAIRLHIPGLRDKNATDYHAAFKFMFMPDGKFSTNKNRVLEDLYKNILVEWLNAEQNALFPGKDLTAFTQENIFGNKEELTQDQNTALQNLVEKFVNGVLKASFDYTINNILLEVDTDTSQLDENSSLFRLFFSDENDDEKKNDYLKSLKSIHFKLQGLQNPSNDAKSLLQILECYGSVMHEHSAIGNLVTKYALPKSLRRQLAENAGMCDAIEDLFKAAGASLSVLGIFREKGNVKFQELGVMRETPVSSFNPENLGIPLTAQDRETLQEMQKSKVQKLYGVTQKVGGEPTDIRNIISDLKKYKGKSFGLDLMSALFNEHSDNLIFFNPFDMVLKHSAKGVSYGKHREEMVSNYSFTPWVVDSWVTTNVKSFLESNLETVNGETIAVMDVVINLKDRIWDYEEVNSILKNPDDFFVTAKYLAGVTNPDGLAETMANAAVVKNSKFLNSLMVMYSIQESWKDGYTKAEAEYQNYMANRPVDENGKVKPLPKVYQRWEDFKKEYADYLPGGSQEGKYSFYWASIASGKNMRFTQMGVNFNAQGNKECDRNFTFRGPNLNEADRTAGADFVYTFESGAPTVSKGLMTAWAFAFNFGEKPEKKIDINNWVPATQSYLPKLIEFAHKYDISNGFTPEIAKAWDTFIEDNGLELEFNAASTNILRTAAQLSLGSKTVQEIENMNQADYKEWYFNECLPNGKNANFTIYMHGEADGVTNGPAIAVMANLGLTNVYEAISDPFNEDNSKELVSKTGAIPSEELLKKIGVYLNDDGSVSSMQDAEARSKSDPAYLDQYLSVRAVLNLHTPYSVVLNKELPKLTYNAENGGYQIVNGKNSVSLTQLFSNIFYYRRETAVAQFLESDELYDALNEALSYLRNKDSEVNHLINMFKQIPEVAEAMSDFDWVNKSSAFIDFIEKKDKEFFKSVYSSFNSIEDIVEDLNSVLLGFDIKTIRKTLQEHSYIDGIDAKGFYTFSVGLDTNTLLDAVKAYKEKTGFDATKYITGVPPETSLDVFVRTFMKQMVTRNNVKTPATMFNYGAGEQSVINGLATGLMSYHENWLKKIQKESTKQSPEKLLEEIEDRFYNIYESSLEPSVLDAYTKWVNKRLSYYASEDVSDEDLDTSFDTFLQQVVTYKQIASLVKYFEEKEIDPDDTLRSELKTRVLDLVNSNKQLQDSINYVNKIDIDASRYTFQNSFTTDNKDSFGALLKEDLDNSPREFLSSDGKPYKSANFKRINTLLDNLKKDISLEKAVSGIYGINRKTLEHSGKALYAGTESLLKNKFNLTNFKALVLKVFSINIYNNGKGNLLRYYIDNFKKFNAVNIDVVVKNYKADTGNTISYIEREITDTLIAYLKTNRNCDLRKHIENNGAIAWDLVPEKIEKISFRKILSGRVEELIAEGERTLMANSLAPALYNGMAEVLGENKQQIATLGSIITLTSDYARELQPALKKVKVPTAGYDANNAVHLKTLNLLYLIKKAAIKKTFFDLAIPSALGDGVKPYETEAGMSQDEFVSVGGVKINAREDSVESTPLASVCASTISQDASVAALASKHAKYGFNNIHDAEEAIIGNLFVQANMWQETIFSNMLLNSEHAMFNNPASRFRQYVDNFRKNISRAMELLENTSSNTFLEEGLEFLGLSKENINFLLQGDGAAHLNDVRNVLVATLTSISEGFRETVKKNILGFSLNPVQSNRALSRMQQSINSISAKSIQKVTISADKDAKALEDYGEVGHGTSVLPRIMTLLFQNRYMESGVTGYLNPGTKSASNHKFDKVSVVETSDPDIQVLSYVDGLNEETKTNLSEMYNEFEIILGELEHITYALEKGNLKDKNIGGIFHPNSSGAFDPYLLSDVRAAASMYFDNTLMSAYFNYENPIIIIPKKKLEQIFEVILGSSRNYDGINTHPNTYLEAKKMFRDFMRDFFRISGDTFSESLETAFANFGPNTQRSTEKDNEFRNKALELIDRYASTNKNSPILIREVMPSINANYNVGLIEIGLLALEGLSSTFYHVGENHKQFVKDLVTKHPNMQECQYNFGSPQITANIHNILTRANIDKLNEEYVNIQDILNKANKIKIDGKENEFPRGRGGISETIPGADLSPTELGILNSYTNRLFTGVINRINDRTVTDEDKDALNALIANGTNLKKLLIEAKKSLNFSNTYLGATTVASFKETVSNVNSLTKMLAEDSFMDTLSLLKVLNKTPEQIQELKLSPEAETAILECKNAKDGYPLKNLAQSLIGFRKQAPKDIYFLGSSQYGFSSSALNSIIEAMVNGEPISLDSAKNSGLIQVISDRNQEESEEIFRKLREESSEETQAHLDYLEDLNRELNRGYTAVDVIFANSTTTDENKGMIIQRSDKTIIMLEKSVAKTQFAPTGKSLAECYTHERVHDILLTVPSNSRDYAIMNAVHSVVVDTLAEMPYEERIKLFINHEWTAEECNGNPEVARLKNAAEVKNAQDTLRYITEIINTNGTESNPVQELMAHILTNRKVQEALLKKQANGQYIFNATALNSLLAGKGDIISRIFTWFKDFLAKLFGKAQNNKFKLSDNLVSVVRSVAVRRAQINEKYKNVAYANKLHQVSSVVSQGLDYLDENFSKPLTKKFVDSILTPIGSKTNDLLKKSLTELNVISERTYEDLRHEFTKFSTDSAGFIQRIIAKKTLLDKPRELAINVDSNFLRNGLSYKGGRLTRNESRSLEHILLATDLQCLFDKSLGENGMEDIYKALNGDSSLTTKFINEIRKIEEYVPGKDTTYFQDFYINQAKELGYFLAHNQWRPGYRSLPLNSAAKIVDKFGTSFAKQNFFVNDFDRENLIKLVDKLATAYAFEELHLSSNINEKLDLAWTKDLVQQEKLSGSNGIYRLLDYHRDSLGIEASSMGDVRKGYYKENYDSNFHIAYSFTDAEARKYETLGYVEITPEKPYKVIASTSATETMNQEDNPVATLRVWASRFAESNSRTTGAISYISDVNNLIDLTSYIDSDGVKRKIQNFETGPNYSPERTTFDEFITGGTFADDSIRGDLEPIFDSTGKISGWGIFLPRNIKDKYIRQNTDWAYNLASTQATAKERKNSVKVNLDTFKAITDFSESIDPYVNNELLTMTPSELEEFKKDHVDLFEPTATMYKDLAILPSYLKEYLDKYKSNHNHIWIRKTDYNLLFGYKNFSVSQLYRDKEQTITNEQMEGIMGKFKEFFISCASKLFGNKYGLLIESYIRDAVKMAKDNMVIRSLNVMVGNTISNLIQLWMLGLPSYSAVTETFRNFESFKTISEQQRRREELLREITSEGYLLSEGELLKKKAEYARVVKSLEANDLYKFMQLSGSSSLVEDVDSVDGKIKSSGLDRLITASGKEDLINDFRHKPGLLKTLTDFMLVSPDSPLYEFSATLTAGSDVVSKYTYYKHLLKTKYKSGSEEDIVNAIMDAHDAFIFYDVPTTKALQYMNDMGFATFTKYTYRILKTLGKIVTEKPLRFMSYQGVKNMLDWSIFDTDIVSVAERGSIVNPFSIFTSKFGMPWNFIMKGYESPATLQVLNGKNPLRPIGPSSLW